MLKITYYIGNIYACSFHVPRWHLALLTRTGMNPDQILAIATRKVIKKVELYRYKKTKPIRYQYDIEITFRKRYDNDTIYRYRLLFVISTSVFLLQVLLLLSCEVQGR